MGKHKDHKEHRESKPKHPSRQKPPPIDKLMIPAIGIGLALLGYQFFKGVNSEILRVNVLDELELREVFFGEGATGKNYAVLCHKEESKTPVSSVFQDANNDGSAPAEFRLVDCDFVLPSSEKSIADRFKLNMKQRPTIFVSGAVGEPKQVPQKHLKTGNMLVKALRGLLEPKAAKIETTQDLRTKCLEKDLCGLLLKGSKLAPKFLKDTMAKLVKEHPKISFAAIDSSVLYVLNLEEYLDEYNEETQQPRFVVFSKVSGSVEAGKDRLKTSITTLTEAVSYGTMSNLVASVVSKSAETTKITSLPVVKTRTKKLVQEENAKRQRKQEQQKKKETGDSQGGTSSSGGYFSANDGSREGRRLEREKRRQDNRANNPNYREKTPEELAEQERQRRLRMEEQAKQWNMAPEDLPPEGEPFSDEYFDDADEGETVAYEVDEDDEGDDDEDFMDLD